MKKRPGGRPATFTAYDRLALEILEGFGGACLLETPTVERLRRSGLIVHGAGRWRLTDVGRTHLLT